MRRSDRERGLEFSLEVIDRCTHGVVAFQTEDGTPYCIPLTLARVDNTLYFHCAREGRKVDLMRAKPRVCVTFVAQDAPDFQEPCNFTTFFQSVVVTGTVSEVLDEQEKVMALRTICLRVTPEHMTGDRFDRAILSSLPVTGVWRIDMEQITGKEKK